MANTCGGCSAAWAAPSWAHCSGCHETFTAIGNFDKHRSPGQCKRPEDVGLVLGDRGAWKSPGTSGPAWWNQLPASADAYV